MPSALVDVAPFYRVLKPFDGLPMNGDTVRTLLRGEVVDVKGWRNPQPLVTGRMLEPIYNPEADKAFVYVDGVTFADQTDAQRYVDKRDAAKKVEQAEKMAKVRAARARRDEEQA